MDYVYLVSLIVGGFFVVLSLIGGHDHDAGADVHVDAGHDFSGGHLESGHGADWGTGLIDLLTVRALFLFAAFFGLTGTLLTRFDTGEPYTGLVSVLTGLVIGLGGNYLIKQVGYKPVSSNLSNSELKGRTARVLIPFEGQQKGKICLEAKGQKIQIVARGFGEETSDEFKTGEEVVVVRMMGSVAEVLKPT